MTCIVGFKHHSGEIWLGADSRITWGGVPRTPRVDDCQKIYFPTPNVALAFSGNNIRDLARVLQAFIQEMNSIKVPIVGETRNTYYYNQSVRRLLIRHIGRMESNIELFFAISFPNNPRYNELFHYRYNQGKEHLKAKIADTSYEIAGSIVEEPDFSQFKEVVAEVAFCVNPSCDIIYHNGWFYSQLGLYLTNCSSRWLSVSQAFHSAYTRDGQFVGSELRTDAIIRNGGHQINYISEYNSELGHFVQENALTGQRVELLPLDSYDWNRPPRTSSEFLVVDRQNLIRIFVEQIAQLASAPRNILE